MGISGSRQRITWPLELFMSHWATTTDFTNINLTCNSTQGSVMQNLREMFYPNIVIDFFHSFLSNSCKDFVSGLPYEAGSSLRYFQSPVLIFQSNSAIGFIHTAKHSAIG